MKYLTLLSTLSLVSASLLAQDVVRVNDTTEVWENGKQLSIPWAGGINSAHMSEIDLDQDGRMDLVIFEGNNLYDPLTGDKITPLLSIPDTINGGFKFSYAPEYINNFPKLEYFAAFKDFNGDGKADIFTRNSRDRITVYRNDSDTDGLKFTLFINNLETSANGLPIGFPFFKEIFQDFVNMSAYEDIDGDGDIDFLVVDRAEQFIEYHKNISPSLDTIILELKSTCWGNALVNKDTVILNTCNPNGNVLNPENAAPTGNNKPPPFSSSGGKGSKDAGVSILALDLDGDGVKDLLSGNRTHLRMAMNGGTVTSSNFTSKASSFPPSRPVDDMNVYTIPSFVDADHDNVKDLVVSVVWDQFKNLSSVYFYKNTGTTSNPNFVFETESFLQEDMIEVGRGSYPVLFDYNDDSLVDIIVGNEGYFLSSGYPNNDNLDSRLALYENIGTIWDPKFELVTKDFGGLSTIKLDSVNNEPTDAIHPTFGDLDDDGDEDMIVGDIYGRLHYFENNAGPGKAATFNAPVINFEQIDVGDFAAPQLIDLNRDDKLDLVIGEKDGNLNYYENTGTKSSYKFTLSTENLGNVQVKEWWNFWGDSRPFIYPDDSTGQYFLACGSRSGFIYYYDSLEFNGKLTDTFRLQDSSFQNIWHGSFSSIHGADINADSSIDFLVGNQSGGITLYTGDPNYIYTPGISENGEEVELTIFPNPTEDFLYIRLNAHGVNRSYWTTIFDVVGKQKLRTNIRSGDRIDVKELPPGIYFVTVESRNGQVIANQKFIKK